MSTLGNLVMTNTHRALAVLTVVGSVCFGNAANAGAIPYPNIGTPIAIPSYDFTASSTGDITAYFYSSDAADTEEVSMLVNGAKTGIFGLNNHTSAVGEAFDLDPVTAGDQIEFFISDMSTDVDWYSNAAGNSDGFNHAYATAFTEGVSGLPAGTYVGFEDRASGDYDHNDDQFVFTDVASSVISERARTLHLGDDADRLRVLGLCGLSQSEAAARRLRRAAESRSLAISHEPAAESPRRPIEWQEPLAANRR
jgi:hypothetical protein